MDCPLELTGGNLAVRATAVHTTRIITVPVLQFIQILFEHFTQVFNNYDTNICDNDDEIS